MVTVPPLAIVQARMGSSRLPGKMLLPIGGVPLVVRVWRTAAEAFGPEHVVCAIPATPENDVLADALSMANVERWPGPEDDVLGRFWYVAHLHRWHPESVIVRITADDWRKDVLAMRKVAAGWRLPVEQGAEAFTLAMLDEAHRTATEREHLTTALFAVAPPQAPEGVWSIDTPEDYETARAEVEGGFGPLVNRRFFG